MVGLTNARGIAMSRQSRDFEIGIEHLYKRNKPKGICMVTLLFTFLIFYAQNLN